MENPEPTEAEHEQAGTDRHQEEDEMRGPTHANEPSGDEQQEPEERSEE